MKILQVVHSLPFLSQAGTEIYAFDSALELSKRHQVYIFSRYSDLKHADYFVRREVLSGIPVYLINNTFRDCRSFEMFYQNVNIDEKFASLLDEIMPDVVHIQHLAFLSIGIIKKAKERNIPVVFTLHDYWLACPQWHLLRADQTPCEKAVLGLFGRECNSCLQDMSKINPAALKAYYWLRKFLPGHLLSCLRKAYSRFNNSGHFDAVEQLKKRDATVRVALENIDLFMAPSQYIKSQLIRFGVNPGKIMLHYLGLNMPQSRQLPQDKISEKIRFAFIGTVIPAKGLHVLIEAFNGLKFDNAVLKIYGKLKGYSGFEGYLHSLKNISKNINIEFLGEFSHEEISGVLNSVDVLVVPSIWQENSPLIIREAFAAGVPVVASRIGGIPENVIDGENGLLFQPGNAHELQDKLQYIINNPDTISVFKNNLPQVKTIQEEAVELEEAFSS